jgi:hypothetical protein
MNKFEAVSTGNIANTPINTKGLMSPSEKAAFDSQITDAVTPIVEEPLWETLGEEHWTDNRLGASIANNFHRVTRRMPVSGGHIYSVATYAMTYVRGVSDSSITETMQFVADSNTSSKARNFTKK